MKKAVMIYFLVASLTLEMNAQSLKDCSTCSNQLISLEQLKNLSIDEIRLLTNELFARKGYEFENPRFQSFFETKNWYQSKKDNKNLVFNALEKQNIKLFQEQTKQLETERNALRTQLKLFKTFVLADQTDSLKLKYDFAYEAQNAGQQSELLKAVLNKINLDDIHYAKNKGLHSVIIDNGFVKKVYELSIETEKINISYHYRAHSSIIEALDVFTDYHSEEEHTYYWQFEFKNNQLKFIKLVVAG